VSVRRPAIRHPPQAVAQTLAVVVPRIGSRTCSLEMLEPRVLA